MVETICNELTVLAQIEEEIFYPAMREAFEHADLIDEAAVEHASIEQLVEELQGMGPGEGLYAAKVKVLGEYVRHHVKEEEGEIFPKARKSKLDLVVLGEQLQSRKQELQSEEQMLMPAPRQARSAPTRRHAH